MVVTSWAPKVHRASGSGRSKSSAIMHIGFFTCFHGIYLSNAVVSGKTPNKYSGSRSSEDFGIAHRPPRSLECENSCWQTDRQTDRHTHRTTAVTLAAHACRGLISPGKITVNRVATAWIFYGTATVHSCFFHCCDFFTSLQHLRYQMRMSQWQLSFWRLHFQKSNFAEMKSLPIVQALTKWRGKQV